MYRLENDVWCLDPYGYYLQWFEGKVVDNQRTLRFFSGNM